MMWTTPNRRRTIRGRRTTAHLAGSGFPAPEADAPKEKPAKKATAKRTAKKSAPKEKPADE